MSSTIDVCNLALSTIGAENINSLDGPEPQARACNQWYRVTVQSLLQRYKWRLAGKTAALAEVENLKTGQWDYAYDRPNDCLSIRWVRYAYGTDEGADDGRSVPYEIEGSVIYCNLSPAYLRYTRMIEDPSGFDGMLRDALVGALAAKICFQLTGDRKMRAELTQAAAQLASAAMVDDANQQRETTDFATEFVTARNV